MFDILDKKSRYVIGGILLLCAGSLIAKGIFDMNQYRMIKKINKKLKRLEKN